MKDIKELRKQLRARWAGLEMRERRLVLAAASIIGVALLWWVFLQPALRTLREAPARLAALDEQLRVMRALGSEAKTLKDTPRVQPGVANKALQAATDRLEGKGKLSLQGDRATLTLQGLPGEALWAWLGEARNTARARPVEAQLTQGPEGYSGSVVVSLPGGGS
ncbi:type II secretion system protein GspM [Caldimonas brevitalea]|uniref:General secretion pathway protein GspM n=1 Tax=Caldimonas brevitalea TaxID=413882 RepID=A0A0G3BPY9_9BURK|nr:type II secretion system protein GspM [Caldimonas brevitalea]AKJ31482.1 general secretion pathway protein GspM [Caldimonas brevitalea]